MSSSIIRVEEDDIIEEVTRQREKQKRLIATS